jgi:hypothetical protein
MLEYKRTNELRYRPRGVRSQSAVALAKWLKDNGAYLRGTIPERHQKGVDYVKSDQQVRDSIDNLVKLVNAYRVGSRYGGNAGGLVLSQAQDVLNTVQGAFKDGQLIAHDHYGGSLAIMRDISGQFLGQRLDLPPGSIEDVTLITAATTAYIYGFFFAP